jgi:hypothetical protein
MNININVKRKFTINGKEYYSIEEMPDDIREIFKKTIGSQSGLGHEIGHTAVRTKIYFNGTEYDNIDAIPQDVRQLYENVLKGAEVGAAPTGIDITGLSSRMMTGPVTPGTTRRGDNQKPIKIETSFSPRMLIVSITVAALILLLYYLVQSR